MNVSHNHLTATNPALLTWLNTYQPDWAETQTACPNESDPPTVTAVNPDFGFSHVATQIFIHGQNLSQPTTINLGATPLDAIYDSDELIIAIVPAGLPVGWHDLTVQTAGGTSQLPQAYEVLPTNSDDLTATPDWLWTEPLLLREGRPGHLGLNVQRLGGTVTLEEVAVEFSLDGQVHSRGRTQPMAANSTEVTTPLAWTPIAAGQYELCATIDPDNLIPETDETNNRVCRQITVLPPALCVEPPNISGVDIENGALTTLAREVSLDVTAEYFCGNQAGHIRFVEFEYFLGAQRWVPITITPWLPYETVHQDYPWTLLPTFGVRFMSAWAGDRLGNLSRTPAQDHISLVPQTQSGYVAQGGIHFYRFYLEGGQTFQATLQSVTGDADVYVWGPDGALVAFSNNESGSDTVTFPVGLTGTYQIEVVGYG
ncbi:MAG: IPT/TIG domain-containing protein, partial [Anaerolineales bacterium]|nr:IPT/TIG domain-containing protein [Anaerolineales bacterium]